MLAPLLMMTLTFPLRTSMKATASGLMLTGSPSFLVKSTSRSAPPPEELWGQRGQQKLKLL